MCWLYLEIVANVLWNIFCYFLFKLKQILIKIYTSCWLQHEPLARLGAKHLGLSYPYTLTHTLIPSNIKLEMSLSFQDIFTKIGEYLLLDLSHKLAKTKFDFFVCVLVSWFICSLKVGYFAEFSRYFYQNWWKYSHWPIS